MANPSRMRTNSSIAAALRDEMEMDESVVVFGEDVAEAGGPFKTSEGLLEQFGPVRVRDTPISEMGFLGAAVGAAATGLRPVAEIMFVEFLGVALDMVSTEAAKFRYLSGGEVGCPLTVRASVGAGLGFGAQHSQTLEGWFSGTPGLKLCVVSTPQNAYGLLRSSIRDDDPVVVLEPRVLYGTRGDVVTGEEGIVPLGEADVVADGNDLTIVTLGAMRHQVLRARDVSDWGAEVIDLQTLVPWDQTAVLESVSRTRRLAIVEEAPLTGGWGADIAARVGSALFHDLAAPIMRITAPDTHVPFGGSLEERFVPSSQYIKDQVDFFLETGDLPMHWWEKGVVANGQP